MKEAVAPTIQNVQELHVRHMQEEILSTSDLLVNGEDVLHSGFFLSLLNPYRTCRDWRAGCQGGRGSCQSSLVF